MVTSRRSRAHAAALCIAAVLCARTALGASLDDVKALYASASYEAALREIEGLDAQASATADAQQVRVLLLLALGRVDDAGTAAEALVTASPTFVPSPEEFPPRFVTLVTDARRRLLPEIIVQAFADARKEFGMPDHGESAAEFERVLALADDPVIAGVESANDVRTLAAGFLDLLRASHTPTPVAPAGTTGAQAAARPTPTTAAAGSRNAAIARATPPTTEPSVPIRQVLPALPAADRVRLSHDVRGSIKLVIGTDGHVIRAMIEQPIHPVYDALLLAASRNWLYEPARLNGDPVESERILEVELKRP